jgi:ribonucleoside-diphosphate reductase alpha chain
LKVKMVTGKGYWFFVDKANAKSPQIYKDKGLKINNSQLCSEIMLFNDNQNTYTCVLSSMNVTLWDEWKDTDSVYWATVFLDCVASEFISKADGVSGLEKAVKFTKEHRALGLGQCGFHTLLQKKMLSFEGFDAHMLNLEIAEHIYKEAQGATQDLARILGEPLICKGYGVRNTHLIAIAPTKSTALLMGGVSEGINPDPAMSYTQTTSAGEVDRTNPILLDLMKAKGVYSKKHISQITDKQGSVQHVDWLTDEEKQVFKTAFEINQKAVLRLASTRAKYIDQWQSLNLFFDANEDEAWISEVHKEAFLDPNMLALYYVYTQAGVQASKGECESCQ